MRLSVTINGRSYDLDSEAVLRRMRDERPDPVQQHAVLLGGVEYPVKQVLARVTGLSRTDFTSQRAQDILRRLGFELTGQRQARMPATSRGGGVQPAAPAEWAWEGDVQRLCAEALERLGWRVVSQADTATKQHGVDLVLEKDRRVVGAEVKGWPSASYADPRRAAEVKRTRPTTQASHWFSQALMKAMMLRDSQPDWESLIVLPEYSRYRDLAQRTARSRAAAEVHVIFVCSDGTLASDTWSL